MHEIIGAALMSGAFFFVLGMFVGERWRDWTEEQEKDDELLYDDELPMFLKKQAD